MSKFFIDCEFVEGIIPQQILGFNIPTWISKPLPNIQMISIGIVSEDLFMTEEEVKSIDKENHRFTSSSKRNKEYYAISKDFNLKAAWDNEWIRVNVLKPIYNKVGYARLKDNSNPNNFNLQNMQVTINSVGKTNQQIAKEITEFVYTCEIQNDDRYNDKTFIVRTLDEDRLYLVNHKDGCHPCCNVSDFKSIQFYGYYSASDWVAFYQLFGKMIDLPKGFPKYCNDLKMEADRIWRETGKDTKFDKPKDAHNALVGAHFNYNFHKFLNTL